ncbi:MAG: hypothetical protein LBD85_05645 [Oscillospiraceae bacterium]|jgi:hypothetical protein|nr:hypothetical protein [Oscillospiraceae bacterium]
MKIKRLLISVTLMIALAVGLLHPISVVFGVPPESSVNRAIFIAYDDSGSMWQTDGAPNQRWSKAKYALEVFGALLDSDDVMSVYTLNSKAGGGANLTVAGASPMQERTNQVHNMEISTGRTPLTRVSEAYTDLTVSSAKEKWLVFITDGDEFEKPSGDIYDVIEQLEGYAENVKVALLTIECAEPNLSSSKIEIVNASTGNICDKLTELSNLIFQRNPLAGDGRTVNVDIPLSRVFVFAQGETVSIKGIDGAGKAAQSASVRYSDEYNAIYPRYISADDFDKTIDRSLVGEVAVFDYDFRPNTLYKLNVEGADDVKVYFEPSVKAGMRLTNAETDQAVVYRENEDPFRKLVAGDYKIEFGLIDEGGNIINSPLLGNIDSEALLRINGAETSVNDGNIISLEEGIFTGTITVKYLNQDKYRKTLIISGENEANTIAIVPNTLTYGTEDSEGSPQYRITESGITNGDIPYIVTMQDLNGTDLTAERIKSVAAAPEDLYAEYLSFRCDVQDTGQIFVYPDSLIGRDRLTELFKTLGEEFTAMVSMRFEYANGSKTAQCDVSLPVSFIVEPPPDADIVFELISGGTFDVNEDETITPGKKEEQTVLFASYRDEPLPEAVWKSMDLPQISVKSDPNYSFQIERGDKVSTFVLTPNSYSPGTSGDAKKGESVLIITGSAELEGELRAYSGNPKVSYNPTGLEKWLNVLKWIIAIVLLLILFALSLLIKLMPGRLSVSHYTFTSRGKILGDGLEASVVKTRRSISVSAPDPPDPKQIAELTTTVKPVDNWLQRVTGKRRVRFISATTSALDKGLAVSIDSQTLTNENGAFTTPDGEPFELTNGFNLRISNLHMTFDATVDFE